MLRFQIAKFLGHLPYFPKQEFFIRKFYNPDQVYSGKIRKKIINKTIHGVVFECDTSSFLEWGIVIKKGEERALLAFLLKKVQNTQFDHFYDLGANIGFFSLPMSRLIPTSSFEPFPVNNETLRKNLSRNYGHNITIFDYGLSNSKEVKRLFFDKLSCNSGTPSLKKIGKDYVKIQTCIFDEEFLLKKQKLLFKIDIEGHEINALKGMKKTLTNNECFLYVETINPEVVSFLEELGYSVSYLNDNLFKNIKIVDRLNGHILATNKNMS